MKTDEWHPCGAHDGLPEHNRKVLCYSRPRNRTEGNYVVTSAITSRSGVREWKQWKSPIVAWRELPEPPVQYNDEP